MIQTPEGEELARLKGEVDALIDQATMTRGDTPEGKSARYPTCYRRGVSGAM
jgi:hypothetical protein